MKPWRQHKGKIAAAAALGGLLLVQCVTYFWYADDIMPRTALRHLADFGLLRNMDYVIVEPDTWAALSERQRTVLLAELRSYVRTIYFSVEEVPESAIHFVATMQRDTDNYEDYRSRGTVPRQIMEQLRREIEAGRRIVGFKNGMRIRWKLDAVGLFWMKCSPSHWVSMTGAEGRTDVYVWILGWWVRIYNAGHVMA